MAIRNELTEEQITNLMQSIPRAEEVDRLRAEIERLRAMLPPTAYSGVRSGPGEGSWSVFAGKVVEERDAARAEGERLRAEIERLKQEPELLRAELISLANAARKSLADSYDRAREARWRASHE